jgi:hypothetical protein
MNRTMTHMTPPAHITVTRACARETPIWGTPVICVMRGLGQRQHVEPFSDTHQQRRLSRQADPRRLRVGSSQLRKAGRLSDCWKSSARPSKG